MMNYNNYGMSGYSFGEGQSDAVSRESIDFPTNGRNRYIQTHTNDVFERERVLDYMCQECTAMAGEYHYNGCNSEYCPICSSQMVSCDCWHSYIG